MHGVSYVYEFVNVISVMLTDSMVFTRRLIARNVHDIAIAGVGLAWPDPIFAQGVAYGSLVG